MTQDQEDRTTKSSILQAFEREISGEGRFAPGAVIAERYRVVRFIARGGIGEVYEVEDLSLGGRLALKTLQEDIARHKVARERFRREIQLARLVTHRNVCRIFEAGSHERPGRSSVLFLTMELLHGQTLEERIKESGALQPDEALPIVRQMALGLDAAHQEGVIHRDLKSSNVMLEPVGQDGEDLRVVITDFGLARVVEGQDDTVFKTEDSSVISGTIAFMAPEQLKDEPSTPATDVYALGVVVYHMVTGRVPFSTKSSLGSMMQLLQDDAPSPRETAPHLSRRWEMTILRCLEKRPEDRFFGASEVVDVLLGRSRARLPSQSRRRWLMAAAGAAFLAIWLGVAWFWASGERLPTEVHAGDPLQLTADPGLEIDPSISPDGSALAYAADRGQGFEIYARSFDPGARDQQLTSDGRRNVQPAWSPDGSALAFVSQESGGIWTKSLEPPGPTRQLTSFGSRPVWSPDGHWIVFQGDSRKEISERTLPALPPSVIWRVPTQGGEPEPLTRAGEPSGGHGEPTWSLDGRRVAFSAGNRRLTQIWAIDVETRELRSLVSEAQVSVSPVFGPNNDLYYIGISGEGVLTASFAVWRQPLDAQTGQPVGEARKVTRLGLSNIRQMTLSRRADRIIYSALSTVSGLRRLNLDSEGRSKVGVGAWPGAGRRNSRPRFSPDGTMVAFDSWQVGRNLDIWIRDLDTDGPPRQITVDPAWDSGAIWLGDGSLAYFSERQNKRGIWRLDLEAGQHTFLAEIGLDADFARLSPDGKTIAYHSSNDSITLDIWIQDLGEEIAHRLTEDSELAGFPIWSHDGKRLALEIKRGESTQVAVMDLQGWDPESGERPTVRQLTFDEGESWPYSWAPDDDRIAFAGRRGGFWNLFWVSSSTGEVVQLTEKQDLDGYVRYPAWSPNGRMIVFEEARTVGDLWQVELTRE